MEKPYKKSWWISNQIKKPCTCKDEYETVQNTIQIDEKATKKLYHSKNLRHGSI